MLYNKELYKKEFFRLLNTEREHKFFIRKSDSSFKISKYTDKGISSLELAGYIKDSRQKARDFWTITISYYSMLYLAKAAILTKGYETDDHYATQIALGRLMVPDKLEKEDLETLNMAHKIFEEEYVDYFEEARKEGYISRYSATKAYTERRVTEIFEMARRFVAKLNTIIKE